jgi:hypothetical protein
MASLNIGQPVPRRVVQRAISIGIKRVNGEVAPRRIALPILGEAISAWRPSVVTSTRKS